MSGWNEGGTAAVQNQRRRCDAFENVTQVCFHRRRAHGAGHGRRCRTITRTVPPRAKRFHAGDRWGHPFEDIDTLLDRI